jgi:hypothetical protein
MRERTCSSAKKILATPECNHLSDYHESKPSCAEVVVGFSCYWSPTVKAIKQGTASQKADRRGGRKKVINFLIFDIIFAEFPIRFFLVTV